MDKELALKVDAIRKNSRSNMFEEIEGKKVQPVSHSDIMYICEAILDCLVFEEQTEIGAEVLGDLDNN